MDTLQLTEQLLRDLDRLYWQVPAANASHCLLAIEKTIANELAAAAMEMVKACHTEAFEPRDEGFALAGRAYEVTVSYRDILKGDTVCLLIAETGWPLKACHQPCANRRIREIQPG